MNPSKVSMSAIAKCSLFNIAAFPPYPLLPACSSSPVTDCTCRHVLPNALLASFRTHTHTYTHIHTHIYVHARIHTHISTHLYIHMHAYTHMYIHTRTHAHTHTHALMHRFRCSSPTHLVHAVSRAEKSQQK